VHAGEDLHERRLPGAVLADEAVNLAAVERDVPVLECVHRTEALGRVLQFEKWRFGHAQKRGMTPRGQALLDP